MFLVDAGDSGHRVNSKGYGGLYGSLTYIQRKAQPWQYGVLVTCLIIYCLAGRTDGGLISDLVYIIASLVHSCGIVARQMEC